MRAAEQGITPLEYLIHVMREGEDEKLRFEAAKAAAPYVHPRLAAIEHTGADGEPLIPPPPQRPQVSREEWLRLHAS